MVRWVWFVVGLLSCLSGCIFIDESLFSGRGPLREITLSGKGEDKVLLMDISGMLTTSKPTGFFDQPSLPARVKEELTKAEKDSHVKALVLRIVEEGKKLVKLFLQYRVVLVVVAARTAHRQS